MTFVFICEYQAIKAGLSFARPFLWVFVCNVAVGKTEARNKLRDKRGFPLPRE